MPLEEGATAPDFELYDDQQQLMRLSDLQGEKVLLLFFPGAFTRVCTDELDRVSQEIDRYREQDVRVLGISTDSPFVLEEFRRAHDFQFPLLSDHSGEVAARYDAKYEADRHPMGLDRIARRAAFVLDREGRIRYAEVLEDAGKQPDFGAIQRTVAQID